MFEIIKAVLDRMFAAILLVLFFVPFMAIGLLIKRDSPGPIFFRQKRIGLNGKPFKIYKFRSMVRDADKTGPYYTDKGDPRVTKVGVFLRRTSLDELPQLINIVLGHMSFIGPRPDVVSQRSLYNDKEFMERNSVRPGLTGLAQTRHRHDSTVRIRKRYDIFYVRKSSFCLDIKILIWTIGVVLKGSY